MGNSDRVFVPTLLVELDNLLVSICNGLLKVFRHE
jgi:hypothetical protein